MDAHASWLLRGYFDVGEEEDTPFTVAIRDELCRALSLPDRALKIRNYPVGPKWKHTFWWREGEPNYAESQFFARVAQDYPVLSLGVSVEKGLEHRSAKRDARMDRRTWDWPRLVKRVRSLLSRDVATAAAALNCALNFRLYVHRPLKEETAWETRTYSYVDGHWFERHEGLIDPREIAKYVTELDTRKDSWVDAYFAKDLGPAEVDGLSPSAAASILMAFDGIRRRLRP